MQEVLGQALSLGCSGVQGVQGLGGAGGAEDARVMGAVQQDTHQCCCSCQSPMEHGGAQSQGRAEAGM